MVRNYKTPHGVKSRGSYCKENVGKAFEAVTSGAMTRKEACEVFRVKRSTLGDKLTGKRPVASSRGRPQALSAATEFEISNCLQFLAAWGFPLQKNDIIKIVGSYLSDNNIEIPTFKKNLPGSEWVNGFIERHPELSERVSNNIKRARAKICPEEIVKFFRNLAPYLLMVPPTHIFNYDESNLSDDPGKIKMIFKRGIKYPDSVLNHSKSATSFMMCVSANGDILPPYVVYKAKELHFSWQQGGPAGEPFCTKRCCSSGTKFNVSESGWFDTKIFEMWFFETFLPHVSAMEGKKILIGDNLSSHFTPRVLKKCEEENILFICLPANSTHLLQPLDVAYFGPLKSAWKLLLLQWKRRFPQSNTLNKNNFPQMLCSLFNHEKMKNQKSNIKAGFESCGLYPFSVEKALQKLQMYDPKSSEYIRTPDGPIAHQFLNFVREHRGYVEPEKATGTVPGNNAPVGSHGRGVRVRRDGLVIIPNDKYVVQDRLASGLYSTIKEEGKTSKVWENFLRVVDENTQPLSFVACQFCHTVFKHMEKNGTSTLRRHIEDARCLAGVKRVKRNRMLHEYYNQTTPTVDGGSYAGVSKLSRDFIAGEDRKMDLSSLVAGNMNENSMGSVGDNPGTSNDCPIPSPEQYLTEEMDQQPTPSNIQVQRPESYKLRHNNHLSLVLESLAGDESFMDVTLTAQGKAIKAHKSVLSAVSPYFKSVLKENPCQHPIIIMPRDIRFGELNNIISYVYKGEMTVAAEDLPSLLRTAEILQVTGLTPSDSSAMSGTSSSILGQIRGATAAAAANSNMSTSCSSPSPSPAKTVNKKSARYHSTPKLKEVPQSSSYDNEMPDKIDPLDYLNPDMACVKEELSSDDEKNYEASTETAEDVQFPTQIPQDLPVDSSYNSKKGCPLSKKRKSSTETSSLHDDPDEDAGNHSDSLTDECLINQTALFVCPYCFESHRPTEVLQTHLRLKHPSKPSFLCKCGKVFVRQALFEQHKKSCDKL